MIGINAKISKKTNFRRKNQPLKKIEEITHKFVTIYRQYNGYYSKKIQKY